MASEQSDPVGEPPVVRPKRARRTLGDIGEPLVVRPNRARRMLGDCSEEELYEKIKRGDVESYLDGRRRLITVASIKRDIERRVEVAKATGFQHARGAGRPANRGS